MEFGITGTIGVVGKCDTNIGTAGKCGMIGITGTVGCTGILDKSVTNHK